MKVIYTPNRSWRNQPPMIDGEDNVLSLGGNNWNDFDRYMTLNASLIFNRQRFEIPLQLKLLIEGENDTTQKLNELCEAGWNGVFPIPDLNYVSVPSDIDFYKVIQSQLGEEQALEVLRCIRDAGFFVGQGDVDAIRLADTSDFRTSLLRESGAHKSYEDGWKLFQGILTEIKNFDLIFKCRQALRKKIPFQFESSLLPYDINVLIGSNGVGKSHCLKTLVSGWLQPPEQEQEQEQPTLCFDKRPNFSKLILISYSPFEEFNLDLSDVKLLDKSAYKYFGFRQKTGTDDDGNVRIGINRHLPVLDSSHSLIDAMYDDEKYALIKDRVRKLSAAEEVLRPALKYDYCAFEIDLSFEVEAIRRFTHHIEGKNYLFVNEEVARLVPAIALKTACKLSEGVKFIKDGKVLGLSSGQRLFTYIVINVLGSIRDNSLVVIDEPELFLHPTLEIEFIALLKAVLKPFRSKAILATHSLAVVREVPSNCVHIFRNEEDSLDIIRPPFETFGGDMQRISSYVFGDKSVTKPFEDFLVEQSEKHSPERLIELLGDEINEEMTMSIFRLGRRS
ncbi:AAA family ATPase [Vibrio harveyi]|uniref:AAA family ATPase n=1 Tax=Vibrio harveyi TaxID=669 RepID=UPI0038CD25BD